MLVINIGTGKEEGRVHQIETSYHDVCRFPSRSALIIRAKHIWMDHLMRGAPELEDD
jgi:hypothetical protein